MPSHLKPILFATVFTTGAAVLIFEVAAVRALSPYFGASIYVVSSVLTVILAALSVGYYFGGRLADRQPKIAVLYTIIAGSGLIMNLLIALGEYLFPIAGSILPITIGPLILSLFFFFLPAFLLGIDSPFAIKLLTRAGDDAHNGAVVGSTFFWSTLGSILGSLLAGFALIPLLGVQLTLIGTATALSLFATVAFLFAAKSPMQSSRQTTRIIFLITLLSVLIAAVTLRVEPPHLHAGTLLHRSDGLYSQLEVREQVLTPERTIRVLHREVNSSSAVELGTTTFPFQYAEYARAYQALQDTTETVLVIGGGAYTIPRTLLLEDPRLQVSVVEIEPSLIDLAHEYFELPTSPQLTNYPMDARVFLNRTNETYDYIFVDAFQSGHFIPPHLTTVEFFAAIKEHLNENGLLVVNVIGQQSHTERTLAGSLIKTIASVFPEPTVYRASNGLFGLQNLMLLATKDGRSAALPEDFIIDHKDGTASPAPERQLPLSRFSFEQQTLLTDDKNQAELLLAKRILQEKQ